MWGSFNFYSILKLNFVIRGSVCKQFAGVPQVTWYQVEKDNWKWICSSGRRTAVLLIHVSIYLECRAEWLPEEGCMKQEMFIHTRNASVSQDVFGLIRISCHLVFPLPVVVLSQTPWWVGVRAYSELESDSNRCRSPPFKINPITSPPLLHPPSKAQWFSLLIFWELSLNVGQKFQNYICIQGLFEPDAAD